jgi:diguanylate cyclase (GGDEF)-like protein
VLTSKASVALASLLLVAACSAVDYWSGPEIYLSIFYLAPVAVAAWYGGRTMAVLLCLASGVASYLVDLYGGGTHSHVMIPVLNASTRFGFFLVTALLLSRLRAEFLYHQTLAQFDPLTGLANRRLFFGMARQEIERARRTLRPFSVAYFDLDNFKQVNDRSGHAAGDKLLRRVAQVLAGQTRALDTAARLGGDEFALLLPETDATGANACLFKLREAFDREIEREGWPVTLSIGAVTFRQAPRDVDTLIQRADALMYQVKRGGKNHIRHEIVEAAG